MRSKLLFAFITLFLFACSNKKTEVSLNLLPVKQGEYWGYVNQDGKYVINPQFEQAFAFVNGLALVKTTEGKYGYVDEKGTFVIKAIYKSATQFSEGFAAVVKDGQHIEFIDQKGSSVFMLPVEVEEAGVFSEGLALVKSDGKYGFIDTKGKVVIACQFELAGDFSEGLSAIQQKEKDKYLYGYINKEGKTVIHPQFENAWKFSDGKALVKVKDKYGFIDKDGKIDITPQFDDAGFFEQGLALAKQGELWGYINKEGKFEINPQFKEAYQFGENGLAPVRSTTNNKWGFINKEGKMAIDPQFDGVSYFIDDVAVSSLGEKYGLISAEGKYKFNPQFEDINWIPSYLSSVESDYFDATSLVSLIFKDRSLSAFKGISKNSTFTSVKGIYPSINHDNFGNFEPWDAEGNKYVTLKNVGFVFTKGFVSFKAKYRSEPRYSYYSMSYYNESVFDGYEYMYNDNAKVVGADFSYQLNGKAYEKAKEVLGMLKSKLPSEFKSEYKEGEYLLADNGNYYLKFIVTNRVLHVMVAFSKESFSTTSSTYDESPDYTDAVDTTTTITTDTLTSTPYYQ